MKGKWNWCSEFSYTALPCGPYEKTLAFCVTCTDSVMLSEEIPQVHAVGGTHPELRVSFKLTAVSELLCMTHSRMPSALSVLLSNHRGGGSSIVEDRRLRSNLTREEAKLNKG